MTTAHVPILPPTTILTDPVILLARRRVFFARVSIRGAFSHDIDPHRVCTLLSLVPVLPVPDVDTYLPAPLVRMVLAQTGLSAVSAGQLAHLHVPSSAPRTQHAYIIRSLSPLPTTGLFLVQWKSRRKRTQRGGPLMTSHASHVLLVSFLVQLASLDHRLLITLACSGSLKRLSKFRSGSRP
jgi:hypothetical protein